MEFFIEGFAYPKHKVGGSSEEVEKWNQIIFETTKNLPKVQAPCRMKIDYFLSPDRFTTGSPYGPDLDNLTKRLLDELKRTIFQATDYDDGCIVDLIIGKRAVSPENPHGVKIAIDPVRREITSNEFLYFAYGPNMNFNRLIERTSVAEKICIAYLPKYNLRTNKVGQDDSGKANIERSSIDSRVWGVLWSIPESSKGELHRAEGYHPNRHDSHYRPLDIIIFDDGGISWKALTYIACQGRTDGSDLPIENWYYDYIIDGAVANNLPGDYIEQLRKLPVINKM